MRSLSACSGAHSLRAPGRVSLSLLESKAGFGNTKLDNKQNEKNGAEAGLGEVCRTEEPPG